MIRTDFVSKYNCHFSLLLAALHFNENSQRDQKTTQSGEKMWKVSYPKYRHGDGVVQEVKDKVTYGKIFSIDSDRSFEPVWFYAFA